MSLILQAVLTHGAEGCVTGVELKTLGFLLTCLRMTASLDTMESWSMSRHAPL